MYIVNLHTFLISPSLPPSLPPSLTPSSSDPVYFSVEQPSKDVDERANAFFQAIYNSRMSVNQLLEILKQFKDSANKKEKVHCTCMYLKSYNLLHVSVTPFVFLGSFCLYAAEYF